MYNGPVAAVADVEGCVASGDGAAEAGVALARMNRSTPSAERDAAFGSREARPCSPACRQPVRVTLACRSLSLSSTDPSRASLLHPAASTSTAAPIQSVRVFMGLHSLRSRLNPRKSVQAPVPQRITLTQPYMPSLKWTFTAQMTR